MKVSEVAPLMTHVAQTVKPGMIARTMGTPTVAVREGVSDEAAARMADMKKQDMLRLPSSCWPRRIGCPRYCGQSSPCESEVTNPLMSRRRSQRCTPSPLNDR
jgi:hypothetical protein